MTRDSYCRYSTRVFAGEADDCNVVTARRLPSGVRVCVRVFAGRVTPKCDACSQRRSSALPSRPDTSAGELCLLPSSTVSFVLIASTAVQYAACSELQNVRIM